MTKPFASTAQSAPGRAELVEVASGVFAFTASGDPNVGIVVGDDSVLCVDGRATPAASEPLLRTLAGLTDKPVGHLVLTHYHAIRALGASALRPASVVAHSATARWIEERGEQDWESETRRFPQLFPEPEGIPGLTRPDVVVGDEHELEVAGRRVQLRWLGEGHTLGDLVVWLPDEGVLFAGDLVENGATPYAGDASIAAWSSGTLDAVRELDADALVPGRGPVARRAQDVARSVEATRSYLSTLWDAVRASRTAGGSLSTAATAARAALEPRYGEWSIFEHCFPFNVSRAYDEAGGLPPVVWTAERDAAVWEELQS